MPEARNYTVANSHLLASSAKSNASYMAINMARKKVYEKGALSVPLELRNAPNKLMKDLNHGKEYDLPTITRITLSNKNICPMKSKDKLL